jgi:hypothetical protein
VIKDFWDENFQEEKAVALIFEVEERGGHDVVAGSD